MNQETQFDKLLNIHTSGRDDSHSDQYRFPYEPTPYKVLERLAGSGYLTKQNTLLDYGCGKGRVDFFLSYQTKCHSIGIEYDERIYEAALRNQESAISSGRCSFHLAAAEGFQLPVEVDRCYFFNPFSVEILQKCLSRIRESYYEVPREILLFFYYPSDEYVAHLMTQPEFLFSDEIDCMDLFPGQDSRERILVFEMNS